MSPRLVRVLSALVGAAVVIGLAYLVPALAQGGSPASTPPVNDRIDQAVLLSEINDLGGLRDPAESLGPLPVSDSIDATLATAPAGELIASGQADASVWWRWTAPADDGYLITTVGSEHDTRLEVFTGSPGSLTSQGSAQGGGAGASLTLNGLSGTAYYIAVDQEEGSTGQVELTIDFAGTAPANDSFAAAIDATGTEGPCIGNPIETCVVLSGHSGRASAETGEANHGGEPATRSAWWRWTPAATTQITLDTCGSTFDTTLGVYVGSLLGSLQEVAGNDDTVTNACGDLLERGYSQVVFTATGGVEYFIAIDGFAGESGSVGATLHLGPPPALCNGLPVTIMWGPGAAATAGDDVILGTANADTINGLGGDDTICAEGGDDIVLGGDGEDTIFGGDGDDDIRGQRHDDTLHGEDGEDKLRGGDGADEIHGGADDDFISGQGGADDLYGDAGEDGIRGGDDIDTMYGGPDKDFMQGGEGDDFLYGEGGNDRLSGNNGNDTIEGGDQPDRVYGGNGNDIIDGGAANDILNGQGDNDTIHGGLNNDTLNGGSGNDTLNGNEGNDEIRGQGGDDDLFGGDGDDDVLIGGDGADDHDGGPGVNDFCNGAVDAQVDTATGCETETNIP